MKLGLTYILHASQQYRINQVTAMRSLGFYIMSDRLPSQKRICMKRTEVRTTNQSRDQSIDRTRYYASL